MTSAPAASRTTARAIQDWSSRFSIPLGEENVLMSLVRTLGTISEANDSDLEHVPIETKTKELVQSFFGSKKPQSEQRQESVANDNNPADRPRFGEESFAAKPHDSFAVPSTISYRSQQELSSFQQVQQRRPGGFSNQVTPNPSNNFENGNYGGDFLQTTPTPLRYQHPNHHPSFTKPSYPSHPSLQGGTAQVHTRRNMGAINRYPHVQHQQQLQPHDSLGDYP